VVVIVRRLLAVASDDAPTRRLRLCRDAEDVLIAYGWPGNIRELRNVLSQVAIDARGSRITARHLRAALPGSIPGDTGRQLYKVVFEEKHLAERRDGQPFELQDYFDHPEDHRGIFPRHAAHLALIVNCIYWTPAYPRLLDRRTLGALFEAPERPRLIAIGDISCDIDGVIESTVKATTPGVPAYVFDTRTGALRDGVEGSHRTGIAMMTTDCLPCELPREASSSFTRRCCPSSLPSPGRGSTAPSTPACPTS